MAGIRRKHGEVYDWGTHPLAEGATAYHPYNYTFDGRLLDHTFNQELSVDHAIPDQSNPPSLCPGGLPFDLTFAGEDNWQQPTLSYIPQCDFTGHFPDVMHHDGYFDTTALQHQAQYQRTPSISTISSLSSPITTSSDIRHNRISLWEHAGTPDLSHDTIIQEPHEPSIDHCTDAAALTQDPSALIFPPLPPQREPPMGTMFIAQSPRHKHDLYTPTRTRHARAHREGWCGFCARWLNLKNSEFNYDKKYNHGICPVTGARFETPKEYKLTSNTRSRRNSIAECWRGLCGECGIWIGLGSRSLGSGTATTPEITTINGTPSDSYSSSGNDNNPSASSTSTTSMGRSMTAEEEKWASVANHWWRHAFQCHEYARVGGKRSRAGSRSLVSVAAVPHPPSAGGGGSGGGKIN